MHEKGFLVVADPRRPKRFRPTFGDADVRETMIETGLDRIHGGSIVAILQYALASRPLSKQERQELRVLIEEAEKRLAV